MFRFLLLLDGGAEAASLSPSLAAEAASLSPSLAAGAASTASWSSFLAAGAASWSSFLAASLQRIGVLTFNSSGPGRLGLFPEIFFLALARNLH